MNFDENQASRIPEIYQRRLKRNKTKPKKKGKKILSSRCIAASCFSRSSNATNAPFAPDIKEAVVLLSGYFPICSPILALLRPSPSCPPPPPTPLQPRFLALFTHLHCPRPLIASVEKPWPLLGRVTACKRRHTRTHTTQLDQLVFFRRLETRNCANMEPPSTFNRKKQAIRLFCEEESSGAVLNSRPVYEIYISSFSRARFVWFVDHAFSSLPHRGGGREGEVIYYIPGIFTQGTN